MGQIRSEDMQPGVVVTHSAAIELTDAQIKALPSTSIQIIPAPGANKVLVFNTGSLVFNRVGDYSPAPHVDGYVQIEINGSPVSSVVDNASGSLGALLGGESSFCFLSPANFAIPAGFPNARAHTLALSNVTNAAMSLVCSNSGGGDFEGGDSANTLNVFVTYQILDVVTGEYV